MRLEDEPGPDVPAVRGFGGWRPRDDDDLEGEQLSAVESRALRLLLTPLSLPTIALRLHVRIEALDVIASSIYRKLLVQTREEAVVRARTLGVINTGEGAIVFPTSLTMDDVVVYPAAEERSGRL